MMVTCRTLTLTMGLLALTLLSFSKADICQASFTRPHNDEVFFTVGDNGDVFVQWSILCPPSTDVIRVFTWNGQEVGITTDTDISVNCPVGPHNIELAVLDARDPSTRLAFTFVNFSIWELKPDDEIGEVALELLGDFANRGLRFNLLPPLNPNKDPLVSIVYVTNRPGGYDLLLHSLANQSDRRYELISVDELSPQRYIEVTQLAQQLGVRLRFLTVSKPPMPEVAARNKGQAKKFGGVFNACNTGMLASSAPIITLQMDFSWLPPDFVERTITFFHKHPKAILGYPCHNFLPDKQRLNPAAINDPKATSIFDVPIKVSPFEAGFERSLDPLCFNADFHTPWIAEEDGFAKAGPLKGFWDGVAYSIPWNILEALNGMDELLLSFGDDSGNSNIQLRAGAAGVEEWTDSRVWLQSVENRAISKDLTWNRESKHSNFDLVIDNLFDIALGNATLRAPNNFDLRRDRGRVDLVGHPVGANPRHDL